jgi:hypothetical protein
MTGALPHGYYALPSLRGRQNSSVTLEFSEETDAGVCVEDCGTTQWI